MSASEREPLDDDAAASSDRQRAATHLRDAADAVETGDDQRARAHVQQYLAIDRGVDDVGAPAASDSALGRVTDD